MELLHDFIIKLRQKNKQKQTGYEPMSDEIRKQLYTQFSPMYDEFSEINWIKYRTMVDGNHQ